MCLQFCFACSTFWQWKGISEAFEKVDPIFFFFCIQLVPSLFGHEHTATMNNENSIMFPLDFCLLAAMIKITLQLSFTTGLPSQPLAATLLWGAAAQEYFKREKWQSQMLSRIPPWGQGIRKQEALSPQPPQKGWGLRLPTYARQLNIWSSWDLINYTKGPDNLQRLETYILRRKPVNHNDKVSGKGDLLGQSF